MHICMQTGTGFLSVLITFSKNLRSAPANPTMLTPHSITVNTFICFKPYYFRLFLNWTEDFL